jgi:hypothetical protein
MKLNWKMMLPMPTNSALRPTVRALSSLPLSALLLSVAHASPPSPHPSSVPTGPGGVAAFRTAANADGLRIQNLQSHAGKKLHVFYVSAREAALGFSGQSLKIRAIKHGPVLFDIPPSGEVQVPAVRVPNSGFQTFNYVVIAITARNSSVLYLRNADGTYPEDPRKPNYLELQDRDFKADKLGFISTIQLNDLRMERIPEIARVEPAAGATTSASLIPLDATRDF